MNSLITSTLLAALPAGAREQADDLLKATIQERENQWSAAYNANDVERLLTFYEVDAVLIPPGSPPVTGHEAIGSVLESLFPVLTELSLVVDEVRPLGEDHAVEIGRALSTSVAEDGTKTAVNDNYQVVWHRAEDGVWRYQTDMFNARE
jgi:uncharacterized protein (TIGR02246 family)